MSNPPRLRRSLAVALLAISTALAAEPAMERAFTVESLGWLRVPLSEEVLREGPAGGLEVIGPDGGSLPFRLVSDAEGRTFAVTVTAVRRSPDGWVVDLDAGARAPRHDRLHFDFEQRAALAGVRLSSSPDGRRFRNLASGDLFRLGTGGGLAEVDLAYPPTDDRYLRLLWPLAGELPELRKVAVDEVGSGRRTASFDAQCSSNELLTVCELPLPHDAVSPRSLELELEESATAAVRLLRPTDGAWELAHQAVWESGGHRRHVLPIPSLESGTSALRLELSGVPNPPSLIAAAWQLPNAAVELYARQVGVHRLRSGPSLALSRPLKPAPAGTAIRRSPLSAAVAVDRPGPQLAPLAQGGELPAARPRARSRLVADTRALSWVRLELPPTVLDVARGRTAGLRLSDGAIQIPYLLWSPPEPVIEFASRIVTFAAPSGSTASRAQLAMAPSVGAKRQQLILYAPARPIDRNVRVFAAVPSPRPGVPAEERWVAGDQWRCASHAALPCSLSLDLRGWSSGELTIEIDDGDNSPLSGVRAELWRDRQELVFLWPESRRAELLIYPDLRSPRYDLAAYRESLLRHPAFRATTAELEQQQGELRWPSWVLPAAVALAALLLLGLLLKLLRGETPPASEP